MTLVEKSHKNDNYYITLEIDESYGRNFYKVHSSTFSNEGTRKFSISLLWRK